MAYEAPRLKIARARRHIEELNREIATFLSRQPMALVVEKWKADPGLGTYAWVVRIRETVPAAFAPIVGDAIHNIRASLDLLASDLLRESGVDLSKVYFPFADSEFQLPARIKSRGFHKAGDAAVDLVKKLRPYKGGNIALCAVHNLDIRDKHQSLLLVAHGVKLDLSGLSNQADSQTREKLANWSTRISVDGQEVVIMPGSWSPPLGTKIKATYLFGLDEPHPIGGTEIIATLNQLADICEGVIEEFERLP